MSPSPLQPSGLNFPNAPLGSRHPGQKLWALLGAPGCSTASSPASTSPTGTTLPRGPQAFPEPLRFPLHARVPSSGCLPVLSAHLSSRPAAAGPGRSLVGRTSPGHVWSLVGVCRAPAISHEPPGESVPCLSHVRVLRGRAPSRCTRAARNSIYGDLIRPPAHALHSARMCCVGGAGGDSAVSAILSGLWSGGSTRRGLVPPPPLR